MKYLFYLLLLLCLACKDKKTPQATELCTRIDETFRQDNCDTTTINSIVAQAQSLPSAECYAVTLNAAIQCVNNNQSLAGRSRLDTFSLSQIENFTHLTPKQYIEHEKSNPNQIR